MNALLILLPVSLVLLGVALWAFFWAVEQDQFEDLDRAARAPLQADPETERDS
jgi:cbb3-type cytochrome oxidase maturation protein